jgi:hypothetical protein
MESMNAFRDRLAEHLYNRCNSWVRIFYCCGTCWGCNLWGCDSICVRILHVPNCGRFESICLCKLKQFSVHFNLYQ